MHFKLVLMALVATCLLADVSCRELPKKENLGNLLKNLSSKLKSKDLKDGIDEAPQWLLWEIVNLYEGQDDLSLPYDIPISIPITPELPALNATLKETHLRGLHKINRNSNFYSYSGGSDWGSMSYIFGGTIGFRNLELHTKAFLSDKLGYRLKAALSNVLITYEFYFYYSIYYPPEFYMTKYSLDQLPHVALSMKTEDSQYGEIPLPLSTAFEKYIKEELVQNAIKQAFTQSAFGIKSDVLTGSGPEKHMNKAKSSITDEPLPWEDLLDLLLEDGYFVLMSAMKIGMTESYPLKKTHEVSFGLFPKGEITLSNGRVSGLDYFKRTNCEEREDCYRMECPGGSVVLDYDDIYINYEVQVKYLGITYNGNATVTVTGLQEQGEYACSTEEYEFPSITSRKFLKHDKPLVDVVGIPVTLILTHQRIIEYADEALDSILQDIAEGNYSNL